MKTVKNLILLCLFCSFNFVELNASVYQSSNELFIETQATITEIETVVHAKRSVVTAKLKYVTNTGDSISSQTNLMHLPLIGTTKKVGDIITIRYQKNNPYLVESQEQSFMQAYGWYVIGAITILYLFIRIKSSRKR